MRRVIGVLVVLTGVLSGLIAYRVYRQSVQMHAPSGGSGQIEGVTVDLSSRVGARVTSVRVKKGDQVKKGDLLVTLDCSEAEAQLAEAEARLAAAQAQAEAASASLAVSHRKQEAAEAARAAAQAQVAAVAAQRAAAERQARRLASLSQDVSASSIDQVKAQAEGLGHQVSAAEAQAEATAEQARAAQVGIRASGSQADAALAQVHAAEAAVKRVKLLVAECQLSAPRDAAVSELPYEVGELVSPGAVLVRLVDLSEVKATFYLPNAEVSAVRSGAPAVVEADAYPGEAFKGKVTTVALEAEFTPRNIQTRTDRDRLVYPVEVLVENPQGKLRAGMPVQVTLPGTER